MRIIGPPSADVSTVLANLPSTAHTRFRDEMLAPLWAAAVKYGIDPVGPVVQAFKETGGGTYQGRVKPEHYNTCGLKVRHLGLYPEISGDLPLAHAMFASWEVGAEAHVQHVRAYTGWPVTGLVVDPRYWLVVGKHACENWADLGGKWAPSLTYGAEIEVLARKLQGR